MIGRSKRFWRRSSPGVAFPARSGRPFAETSAELSRAIPEHADLIAAWGPRFNETLGPPIAGMRRSSRELDSRGVPLFAITNFSGEFFRAFVPLHPDIFGSLPRYRRLGRREADQARSGDLPRWRCSRFGLRGRRGVHRRSRQ
jgi:hypothetical protein